MTQPENEEDRTFGIGAVAKFTGLSPHTIRVWERRYQVVVARRASNGRRLYTTRDIEKLNVLKQLTDTGVSIGRIANESLEVLVERAGSVCELTAGPAPAQINIAVLGDFLPSQLRQVSADNGPLHVVVSETSEDHFIAATSQQQVDVVIVELPAMEAQTLRKIRQLMTRAGATRAVIVYSFGRSADLEQLRNSNIVVLRSPVTVDELRAAIERAYTQVRRPKTRAKQPDVSDSNWRLEGVVEPRRFDQKQLATLANISSTIDCECPQHLAQLVGDLHAFEVYSAQCANRDDDDAALHRYLYHSTARARAMIEEALERVAKAEGLAY